MPATLTVTIKGTDRVLAMMASFKGQLPYAQMVALNRTAEDILKGMREQVARTFTVRTPGFILPPQLLPREWKATKTNLHARVQLGDGGAKKLGERRRAILEPFEPGEPKKSSRFGPVAIPTTYLRPTRTNLIEPKLYPRHLVGLFDNQGNQTGTGLKARISSRTNKRTGAIKGQQVGRYFVMGGASDKMWGLYERQPGQRLRKLWNFRPSVRRPAILSFDRTTYAIFNERWQPNYAGAIELALRSAR